MLPTNWLVLKGSKLRVRWNLRTAYKVTEFKGNAVYKTKFLGFIVCESNYRFLNNIVQLHSTPTSITRELL